MDIDHPFKFISVEWAGNYMAPTFGWYFSIDFTASFDDVLDPIVFF
jgi:hypothetical protein